VIVGRGARVGAGRVGRISRSVLPVLFSTLPVLAAPLLSGCGVFAMHREFADLKAQDDALAKRVQTDEADLTAARADLQATRDRLENALRANADTGSDLLSSKARINDLAGRADELAHAIDELRKNQQDTRNEIDTKLDAITRQQAVQQTPQAPPVQVPADKEAHFQAVQGAYAQKDWPLVRTLGHEYVVRYPGDDRADDVQFLLGDADLQDKRPTSALGEFNRLLKVYPRSDKLGPTLFAMGEAYLQLHDCANAKLAFGAVEQRFAKDKLGVQAKARIAAIDHPVAGMCAPQP
jgi:TolA-binding protein